MGKFVDITGKRYGKLVVLERGEDYVSPSGYVAANWICKCDCGKNVLVRGCNLKSGATTSCGCERILHPNRYVHGMKGSRLYSIWKGMKTRCFNENDASYPDYGGRGITLCDEWENDFLAFYTWSVNNGYNERLSIDRINNNGNYCPDNCRWADRETQGNNQRTNHLLTYGGETLTMSQWAKKTGIGYYKLKDRIDKLHWSTERALTTK